MTRSLPPLEAFPTVVRIWPNVEARSKPPFAPGKAGVHAGSVVAQGTNSPPFGGPKFVWLMISKNSARNSTRNCSEIFLTGVSFNKAKSKLTKPGPSAVFRGRLPSSPTFGIVMLDGNAHH